MTKAKKALSLILSVVMLFTVISVVAYANDNTGVTETGTITLTYDKTSYAANDTVTVTVALTTDYYAASTSVPVEYDATAVTFVSGTTASTLFGSGTATKTVVNNATGTSTYVAVGVLPQSGNGAVAQKANNVVLTVLTFTATKAISDTSKVFGVKDDQKTMANLDGLLYVGSYKTSDVTSTVYTTGQVLTFPKKQAASGGTPELVLAAANNGAVIDKKTACAAGYAGFVYGIEPGETLTDYVTTAVGSVSVVKNDQNAISTGATIQLKDAGGQVVETYLFVVFGDLDGEGSIDANDESILDGIASYMDMSYAAGDGSAISVASDLDGTSDLDANDVSIVDGIASYMDMSTQAELAATYAAGIGI